MNELVKKGFEILERYWHKVATAFIAPASIFTFWLFWFYSAASNSIPAYGFIVAGSTSGIILIVWLLTNRLPRVTKGNTGIVIGILCDDPEEDKQVKTDFIANLRLLINEGGSKFQLLELPKWTLGQLENSAAMTKLLRKVRGHFLLSGRVKLRNKDGKPVHLLAFGGVVLHRPVPDEVSKELSIDFTKVLPTRVVIEKENDAFQFEATSEWADVSARYIIGTAALISGDVGYAEELYLYVQNKLKQNKNSNIGVREIAKLLPRRFAQLYSAWQRHLYAAYFSTRNVQFIVKSDDICSKLLLYEPTNPHALLVKAICEFLLRKDIPAAHKLITRCRNEADSTWWYSRAFLHAYQGKMEEATSDYQHAFSGPIRDKSVPVQCEEFINLILKEEPDRIQLHYCLGLINFHAKQDFLAAEKDFGQFLAKLKTSQFHRQALSAQQLLKDCKTKQLENIEALKNDPAETVK